MSSNHDPVETSEDVELWVSYLRTLQRNAEALLSDAELLFLHARWARALALAVLAREEVGKAILDGSALLPDEEPMGMKSTLHQDKLITASLVDLGFLGDLGNLRTLVGEIDARSVHREKLSAIYVDLRDGAVTSPLLVTKNQAERAIDESRRIIQWVGRIFGNLSVEAIEGARHLTNTLGPVLERYVRDNGEEAGLAVARQLLEWSQTLTSADPSRTQATPHGEASSPGQ